MIRILHRCATATQSIRLEIQTDGKSVRDLARELGLGRSAVWKWKTRDLTKDLPMGRRNPLSTVLSPVEKAVYVAFRHHALPPLDECPCTLQ